MKCFERLVKSHFIANISAELELARKTIKDASQSSIPPVIYANIKDRKALYDRYVYEFYLKEEVEESLKEEGEYGLIYFIQFDDIMYIYSLDKTQLNDTVQYNYDVSGNLPLHRSRHKMQGKMVYTALFDKRLSFESISPN